MFLAAGAFPRRFRGGDERGGELFVKGEEVFHPVPVAGERLGPVTAVHRAVQFLVRLEQRRSPLAARVSRRDALSLAQRFNVGDAGWGLHKCRRHG